MTKSAFIHFSLFLLFFTLILSACSSAPEDFTEEDPVIVESYNDDIFSMFTDSDEKIKIDLVDYMTFLVNGTSGSGCVFIEFDKPALFAVFGDGIRYTRDLREDMESVSSREKNDYLMGKTLSDVNYLPVSLSLRVEDYNPWESLSLIEYVDIESEYATDKEHYSALFGELIDSYRDMSPEDFLFSTFSLRFEIENNTGLSNGDTVDFSLKDAEILKKYFNVDFVSTSFSYRVNSLKP